MFIGKAKVRNKFLRAFQQWYLINESKLPFRFYIEKRFKDTLILCIKDINPDIFIKLGYDGVDICAVHNECNDILLMLDVNPVRENGMYKDSMLSEEEGYMHIRYSSREEMWEKELFEYCVKFINETLLPAKRLRFYGWCIDKKGNQYYGGWASLEDNEINYKNGIDILKCDLPVHTNNV